MEIYKDDHDISRAIFVAIENSTLTVNEQDLGKGFESERIIETDQLREVKKLFQVNTDEELLDVIKERYSCSKGFDMITDLFSDNKIEFKYNSFTS